jgi:hypothetical protein
MEPRLEQIVGGWAARGRGWAVHAPTKEEALKRYAETQERYTRIDARPDPSGNIGTSPKNREADLYSRSASSG